MTATATGPILVVDDDVDVTELLLDVLHAEGYRVITSTDAGTLATVAANPPALILLDIRMPTLDGAEICRRLQADPRTQAIPVVFITGAPRQDLDALLRDCAVAEILPKPFGVDEVLALVRRYVTP